MSHEARRNQTDPSQNDIDAALRDLDHNNLPSAQRGLLAYLLRTLQQGGFDVPDKDTGKPRTGERILFDFYIEQEEVRPGDWDELKPKSDVANNIVARGKKVIELLHGSLERFYRDWQAGKIVHSDGTARDRVVHIDIAKGKGNSYRPRVTWWNRIQTPPANSHVGTNQPGDLA